ncbi:hypothetical protein P7F88_19665 [Vibrio hannami]|uniref:hypothetical protein n=1 Tax=Vibrio hannami TaxID=2717094 RepID=UPI00241069B5|nr:hypothetical protein [Vibrio hannami]MDG3088170.1 hypothetical protein [Vibrio hannami]
MTRLLAIATLLALAVLLFKYRTNEKVQRGVVISAIIGLAVYTVIVVFSELMR